MTFFILEICWLFSLIFICYPKPQNNPLTCNLESMDDWTLNGRCWSWSLTRVEKIGEVTVLVRGVRFSVPTNYVLMSGCYICWCHRCIRYSSSNGVRLVAVCHNEILTCISIKSPFNWFTSSCKNCLKWFTISYYILRLSTTFHTRSCRTSYSQSLAMKTFMKLENLQK